MTIDVGAADPPSSSEALYLAVICQDYPQLWDPATPVGERLDEVARRLAAYPKGTFAPLSPSAWIGTDYEGVLACLRWPSPTRFDPPDPPGATYPNVPTLVLNGDLDTITASSGAREVARRFPNSTFVELRNSLHVTVLYDRDACASRLYVRFVRRLDAGDTTCAERVAEVHLVPSYPTSLRRAVPARAREGDRSLRRDRKLASVAAATVADVLARWWVNYDGTSVGLRGGRWSYTGDDRMVFELDKVQLVRGVEVSGTARWSYAGGGVRADVRVRGPSGSTGALAMRWSLRRPHAVAMLGGNVDGRALRATMLAP